jgi:hypothetical protein
MNQLLSLLWRRDDAVAKNLLMLGLMVSAFAGVGAGRICIAGSLVFFVVDCLKGRARPAMPLVGWLVTGFCVWITLALYWGPSEEVVSNQFYRHLFWLNIPLAFVLIRSTPDRLRMLQLFALGAGILGLETLLDAVKAGIAVMQAGGSFRTDLLVEQVVFHRALGGKDLMGTLVNIGDMQSAQILAAGMLVTCGLMVASAGRTGSRVPWLSLALFVQALGLFLTFKRGALLALVVVAALYLTARFFYRRAKQSSASRAMFKSVALWGSVAVVITLMIMPPEETRQKALAEAARKGGRVCMWVEIAPALIKEYPFGIGYKALTNEMMRDIAPRVERHRDHMHSNPLQVLVDGGWPGLALFVLIIVMHFRDGLRALARTDLARADRVFAGAMTLSALMLMLNGLVEYQLGSGQINHVYGFLMGVVAAAASRRPAERGHG